MNIPIPSQGDFEFRQRFGARYEQNTWAPANGIPTTTGYLRDLGKKIGRQFKAYPHSEKKRSSRERVRTYAVYLGIFVTVVTVFAFYIVGTKRGANIVSDNGHSPDKFHYSHRNGWDAGLQDGDSDPGFVPSTLPNAWHQRIFSLRPKDVINHRFDHMVISILLGDVPSVDGLLHSSINTFLRQINRLQIATEASGHTFIGGAHNEIIAFTPETTSYPKLERYVDGYKTMLKFSPLQDWFIQIDEENINIFLQKHDASKPLFFHNFDLLRDDAIHFPATKQDSHFPVSIMSRAALELFVTSNYPQCFIQNKYIQSEETILAKCLKQAKIKVVAEPLFHNSEPSSDFTWPVDSCKRPLSISQLTPTQLQYLFRARETTGTSLDGTSYKWDTIVTYSDVFHHTFGSLKPTPNIARHTATTTSVETTSGEECRVACVNREMCVSWTFEEGRCYVGDAIGVAVRRTGVVSGIISTRYNCQSGGMSRDARNE